MPEPDQRFSVAGVQQPERGNPQQARHPAASQPTQADPQDERPPEDQEEQPTATDTGEPPTATREQPHKRLFGEVPETPAVASANLAFILSVVADKKHRQAIETFARTYGDKREDHMLTQAAAMATAILENHVDRAGKVHDALDALFRAIAQEAASLAEGGAEGGAGYDLETLREVFRDEATAAYQTAYRLGFRTALWVAGGGVVVGLLIAFLIHIL